MKRLLSLLVMLAIAASASAADKRPCTDSVLCGGLVSHFDFEEGSDAVRESSSGGGMLVEPDGQNIGNTTGKFGNAVLFGGTATSYLEIPETANFGNSFYSFAVWVYPTSAGSAGQKQAILSTNSANSKGETLYLENVSGNLRAKWQVTGIDDAAVTVGPATNVSLNAWHLLVVYVYPDFTSTGGPACVMGACATIGLSLDGAAYTSGSLTYPIRSGLSSFRLGGQPISGTELPYTGRVDSVTTYSGFLSAADVTLLYNSGSGRAYPFSTP